MFEVFVLLLIVPLYFKLKSIRKKQDEESTRLTQQLHALYDAVNQQRQAVDRVLRQIPTEPLPKSKAAALESREETSAAQEKSASVIIPPFGEPLRAKVAAALSRPEEVRPNTAIPSPSPSMPVQTSKPVSYNVRPPEAPEPPRVPGRFEAAAADVLKRIWNWIIVGEEHIPQGVSVEFAVASQWLLRIGIVLLVVGVGFFLKYSVEHGLLSPAARVGLSIAAGLVMLISGTRILGGSFHVMGQGLLGGGIATLYFSAFAAANFYHLITMPIAFAAMIVVTALSGFIAVRFHSKLTAVLGVVGGYATPVMLSTGQVNFPGLYGYMLVLGLGVLGTCAWKRWPLLSYLSFVGNFLLVGGSLRDYQHAIHFWQVMPFLIAFFVLFSTMVFVYNLVYRTKSNLLDVLVLFLNAAIFFGLSYRLIDEHYGEKWVAAATLGLATFYIAHVWYCLVRRVLDRELMLTFTALSAFFAAVTIPLLLSSAWITVSWSLQAMVMLWIAGKLNSEFLRHVAYLLYLIVLGRFMFLDLPSQYGSATLADLPVREYIRAIIERLVMFGVPIGSLALGYRLLVKPPSAGSVAVNSVSDIGGWIEGRVAARAGVYVVFAMLFFYMHLELNRSLGALFPPLRLPVLTLLWLSVCLMLLIEFARTTSRIALCFLSVFVIAVLLKMIIVDLQEWSMTVQFYYDREYSFFDAGFRLLDFGAIIVFFAFGTRLLAKQVTADHDIAKQAGVLMGIAGVGMLFIYTTLELNSFLRHYVENLRSGGISILWTLFALAFLVRGIGHNLRSLRYVGLALFAIVTWKIFFVDLVRLDQLYRIVAFIVLGVLVLCGSFLYLRSRQTFSIKAPGLDPGKKVDGPEVAATEIQGDSE